MSRWNSRQNGMRARIAAAAARLMAEDGIDDFALAKRKAARQLGAPDTEALPANQEIEAELRRLASPFRTAEAFAVEDLIDPRETRPYLCQFIDALQPRLKTQLGPKYKAGVRP